MCVAPMMDLFPASTSLYKQPGATLKQMDGGTQNVSKACFFVAQQTVEKPDETHFYLKQNYNKSSHMRDSGTSMFFVFFNILA